MPKAYGRLPMVIIGAGKGEKSCIWNKWFERKKKKLLNSKPVKRLCIWNHRLVRFCWNFFSLLICIQKKKLRNFKCGVFRGLRYTILLMSMSKHNHILFVWIVIVLAFIGRYTSNQIKYEIKISSLQLIFMISNTHKCGLYCKETT